MPNIGAHRISRPEEPSGGCTKGVIGCAGAAGLVIGGLWVFLVFLHANGGMLPYWEKNSLPPQLRTATIIYSDAAIGGFIEGCAHAEYRLSPRTREAILRDPIGFLENVPTPSGFGPWHQTPQPNQEYIYALGAVNGCAGPDGKQGAIFHGTKPKVRIDLRKRGNYYAVSGNRESLIAIDPQKGVVLYLSFG